MYYSAWYTSVMFEIDFKSRKTIYEQVVDHIRELILIGAIVPNQQLPSVRELSKSLTVNPNTVQKAFSELERLGYVYTITGVGTFASLKNTVEPDKTLIDASVTKLANEVKELLYLGLSSPDVKKLACEAVDEQETLINRRRQQ